MWETKGVVSAVPTNNSWDQTPINCHPTKNMANDTPHGIFGIDMLCTF